MRLRQGRRQILTVILLLCTLFTKAQKKDEALADSLKQVAPTIRSDSQRLKVYLQICRIYRYLNPDSFIRYARQNIPLAKKAGTPQDVFKLYGNLGYSSLSKGNMDQAKAYYDTAYDVAKTSGDKKLMETAFLYYSSYYQPKSDFTKALDYVLQAARIGEEIKATTNVTMCYANAAALFLSEQDFTRASEYAHKALTSGRGLPNTTDHLMVQAKAYECLGVSKYNQHYNAEARPFYDSALALYQQGGVPLGVANMYQQLANTEEPDFIGVLKYALKAQAVYDSVAPNNYYSIINLGNIGIAYEDIVRSQQPRTEILPGVNLKVSNEELLKTAESYISRSIKLARETNTPETVVNMQDSLALVQSMLGKYKDAFETLREHNVLYDSLYSQENKNKIASVDEKYQVQLRDTQIAAKNQVLEAQVRQRWLLISALALMAIIGLLLFRQNRIRKRTNTTLMVLNNELDEANEVKLKFMSILNHDLRAPIANLVNFLHLQKEAPDLLEPGMAEAYAQKTKGQAENLLLTMEDLLAWSKGQMKNFTPNRRDLPVELLFEDIRNHFTGATDIEFDFEAPESLQLHTDEHYLKTIMRNLTGNAVKALNGSATPHARITWKSWEKNGKQYLSLTDNGPGATDQQLKALYDESQPIGIKSGLGLHLVRDLARAISCAVTVHSEPGKGTEFQLSL